MPVDMRVMILDKHITSNSKNNYTKQSLYSNCHRKLNSRRYKDMSPELRGLEQCALAKLRRLLNLNCQGGGLGGLRQTITHKPIILSQCAVLICVQPRFEISPCDTVRKLWCCVFILLTLCF